MQAGPLTTDCTSGSAALPDQFGAFRFFVVPPAPLHSRMHALSPRPRGSRSSFSQDFELHLYHGAHLGGVHIELTGEAVTDLIAEMMLG